MEKTARIGAIDALKAVAILLMIFGHCIQCGAGAQYIAEQAFFQNIWFRGIYAFHMPLFMLVSGYLFGISASRHSLLQNLKTRFTSLLVPILTWNIPVFAVHLIRRGEYSLGAIISVFLRTAVYSMWFLWAILLCSLIVLAVRYLLRDHVLAYLAVFAVTFFLPDVGDTENYKFMYPFFVLGYLYNCYGANTKWLQKLLVVPRGLRLVASGAAFAVLLTFYNRDCFIYTSGYYIFSGDEPLRQFGIDMYRFVIGLVGCLFVTDLVCGMYDTLPAWLRSALSCLGRNSLGIYAVSSFVFMILPDITPWMPGLHYGVVLLETVVITLFCLLCSVVMRKIKITNVLLLGGRGQRQ